MKNDQLALGVHLKEEATFENFYSGPNQEVVLFLKQLCSSATDKYAYLWGGTGRTHLLQASCCWANNNALTSIYLPLRNHLELDPQIFEEIENFSLVCIDDIDKVAGLGHWEESIFHFYNRAKEKGTCLLLSSLVAPKEASFYLPDLTSRLLSGVIYHLRSLNDSEKIEALQQRATLRGLSLPEEVGRYLLNHCPRDIAALFATLEILDKASLIAQHRLTIPFVKSVLSD